jgi:hypothetical protein
MEMELTGGFKNDAHLALWTSFIKSNKAQQFMPKYFEIDFQRNFIGDANKLKLLERTNAALVVGSRSGTPWNDSRLLRLIAPAFAAGLAPEYCESSWIQVGQMRANPAPANVETRAGMQLRIEQADAEAVSRHHIFPEAVLKNTICLAAKEIAENKLKNAMVERRVLLDAAARFAGMVPALAGQFSFDSRIISSHLDARGESILKLIFGDIVPEGAALFYNAVVRAESVVEIEEKDKAKRDDYIASMPQVEEELRQRVEHQDATQTGLATLQLRKKMESLQAHFEAVVVLSDSTKAKIIAVQLQCDELLADNVIVDRNSTKLAVAAFKKLQTLLAPNGNRKSLSRIDKECKELLEKEIVNRNELHSKFAEKLIPTDVLSEAFGEDVSKDWGAGAAVEALHNLIAPITLMPSKLASKFVIPNVDAAVAAAAVAAVSQANSAASVAADLASQASMAIFRASGANQSAQNAEINQN